MGEILTGILYLNPNKPDFGALLNLTGTPLAQLPNVLLRPSREPLEAVNASLR